MTCPACREVRAALGTGESARCEHCEASGPAPAWHPGAPAGDLAVLLRWLPDLCARALEPCPVTSGPGHSGPSPGALAGRSDRVDDSRGYRRAVTVWRRLRELVALGRGEDVAVLWAAHALVVDLGDEASQRAGRQAAAVALGAAPGPVREGWASVARASRREALERGPDGSMRAVVHKLEVSALAERWGRERLDVLWSPGVVPLELARAVALGWAPAALREAWGHLRSPALRDAGVRAWGEERLRAAEATWRG